MPAGAYHYQPVENCLETVWIGDRKPELDSMVLTGEASSWCAATFVLTVRWDYTMQKYGERGYRISLLEAGHIAQNLLLGRHRTPVGMCPIAGFHDDAVASLLLLAPSAEGILYLITAGNPET